MLLLHLLTLKVPSCLTFSGLIWFKNSLSPENLWTSITADVENQSKAVRVILFCYLLTYCWRVNRKETVNMRGLYSRRLKNMLKLKKRNNVVNVCVAWCLSVSVCSDPEDSFGIRSQVISHSREFDARPLDALCLIYLAMLDGSDEMTTKIKPPVRTLGNPKLLLDLLNMITERRSSRGARCGGGVGLCRYFFSSSSSTLLCSSSFPPLDLLPILRFLPESCFNAILHLTSAKPV